MVSCVAIDRVTGSNCSTQLKCFPQVNLKREKLEISPVYSTALIHDDHKVGYIRLASFSQKAAADLRRHVRKLEAGTNHAPSVICSHSLHHISKLFGKKKQQEANIFMALRPRSKPPLCKVQLQTLCHIGNHCMWTCFEQRKRIHADPVRRPLIE